MSMWILKHNGEIVSRKTLRTLTDSELASETEKINRAIFTKDVNSRSAGYHLNYTNSDIFVVLPVTTVLGTWPFSVGIS